MSRSLTVNVLLIVLYNMYSKPTTASPIDEEIIVATTHKMPASCAIKKETYCFDKGDSYPQSTIDWVVEHLENTLSPRPLQNSFEIGLRGSGNTFDENDCPSNSSRAPIYYIIDNNNKTRVVVQSTKFIQLYNLRWCTKEGPITGSTIHFIKGSQIFKNYNIECANTRMNFEFFVLNDDGYEPEIELVRIKNGIPVCCKCRYSKKNNPK